MSKRRDIDRLQSEIEELFADLWHVPRFVAARRGFRPNVDCYSTADALTVIVDLAGVNPDGIRVHATSDVLHVSGERRRRRVEGAVYHQMEVEYGPFEREVRLPAAVDVGRASASLAEGLLTITLPLATRPSRRSARVELKLR